MYPSLEEKRVTKRNCYFLFELAHEYQIDSIAQKCEALMVKKVKNRMEDDVLAMLIYGQKYQIKTLLSTCIYEARRLTLKELKQHRMRDQIEPDNYLQIAEGIITRLEGQCKEVKDDSLAKLHDLISSLYNHVCHKGGMLPYHKYKAKKSTDQYISRLGEDVRKDNTKCDTLADVAIHLMELKEVVDSLP